MLITDYKKHQTVLHETINDDCFHLLTANAAYKGFNHFDLYVDHNNKVFHIFDPIAYLKQERGTVADYHVNRVHHNLIQEICSSLELDYTIYDKALIYTPSSNNNGIEFVPHGVGNPVPELIKYEPFITMAKIISKGAK